MTAQGIAVSETSKPSALPEWVKRPYVSSVDEDGCMYLLLKQSCHSTVAIDEGAHRDGSPEELAWIDRHRPVFRWLLWNADVEVLCDPEDQSIMFAVAVTSAPNRVHALVVKRSAIKAGLGAEMARDLLGDLLQRRCYFTAELVQMRARGSASVGVGLPTKWAADPTWVACAMARSK